MPEGSDDTTDLSRRTFVRTTGIVAGAGLLGTSASTSAGAAPHGDDEAITSEFLEHVNPRVRRAAHAWERGYRGRADRSLALTDSGADSRHPDIGPWNGVTVTTPGSFELYDAVETEREQLQEERPWFSDVILPGTPVVRTQNDHRFDAPWAGDDVVDDANYVEAELEWTPQDMDLEFYLDAVLEDGTRQRVATQQTANNPEELTTDLPAELPAGDDGEETLAVVEFVFVVETWANAVAEYEISATFFDVDREYLDPEDVELPDAGETPELVAWHNDNAGYGNFDSPRDADSHGTHVSGIMTGTGRGSAIDEERSEIVEPDEELRLPGEELVYEVEARAETGVFGSAYGQGIEVVIEGPGGTELARSEGANGTSEESFVNNTAVTPTDHDDGEATYTVHVRATEGLPLPARVESVAAGAFERFDETGADATGETLSLHGGVAPGNSLVAVTDLGTGAADLAAYAEEFTETFNIRAVNMSWGLLGGLPLGTVAGVGDDTVADVRRLAEAGVLTVAAAGNDGQPVSGNGPPAVADEAVSTVATGPLDGIAAYSSGGIGGVDEETHGPYTKPDVAAIGGVVPDLDQAAMPGEDPENDDPEEDAEQFGTERTYSGKGGTSMASPSACGAAGLVAQAMEEDAPEPIALPEPADTDREDVLRLKQALLATASTTAFNAAPYHRGKAPTYTFGERDPYEGYGRVNVGAAVDAVSRELTDAGRDGPLPPVEVPQGGDGVASHTEVLGLDVPDDEQAVAGYVEGPDEFEVSVSFAGYAGADADGVAGAPHVDLFVYDAVRPEGVADDEPSTGDPNVVASDQGITGDASVAFEAGEGDVYYVVAKLVNVPGAVNGDDVQVELDLDVAFTGRRPETPGRDPGNDRGDEGDGGDNRDDEGEENGRDDENRDGGLDEDETGLLGL